MAFLNADLSPSRLAAQPARITTENPDQVRSPDSLLSDAEHEASIDEAVDFLASSDVEKLLSSSPFPQRLSQIPSVVHTTPPSSNPDASDSSREQRKRVDFAPFTSITRSLSANASFDAGKENSSASLIRKLRPSKERPGLPRSKSILKASKAAEQVEKDASEMPKTWTRALELGLRQLASKERSMRLDAWRELQAFLENLPDIGAVDGLQEQHEKLLRLAQRDMQFVEQETEFGAPNQLPNYATRFLSTFVRLPQIKNTLPTPECKKILSVLVANLAVNSGKVSKSLMRSHLYLLHEQQFSPEVMTPARIVKVVEAIHVAMHEHGGNGILRDQMKVYRRLAEQSPDGFCMAAHFWMSDVWLAMFANETDVFRCVVNTAFDLALTLGHRPEASKALQELFWEDSESFAEDRAGFEELCMAIARKTNFSKSHATARLAPKLLAAVFLFMRVKGPFEVFGEHFAGIREIFKTYLRRQTEAASAFTAWSWLIVSQMHGGRWPREQKSMLLAPMVHLLTGSGHRDFSKDMPRSALSTYLTLLYCSFHPEGSFSDLTEKWDAYVAPVVGDMLRCGSPNQTLAADILSALFGSEAPWDPQLFTQSNGSWSSPVTEVSQLPRISSKWVRMNLDKVLTTVGVAVIYAPQATVSIWRALMTLLADGSKTEIRPTTESKAVVASVTNHVSRWWVPIGRKPTEIQMFCDMFLSTVSETSESASSLQNWFMSEILRPSGNGGLEVAATPSSRATASGAVLSAASHFLVLLFGHREPGEEPDELIEETEEPDGNIEDPACLSIQAEGTKAMLRRYLDASTSVQVRLSRATWALQKLLAVARRNRESKDLCFTGTQFTGILETIFHQVDAAVDLLKAEKPGATDGFAQAYKPFVEALVDCALEFDVAESAGRTYRAIREQALKELGLAGPMLCVIQPASSRVANFLRQQSIANATPDQITRVYRLTRDILDGASTHIPGKDLRTALERLGQRVDGRPRSNGDVAVYKVVGSLLVEAYPVLDTNEEDILSFLVALITGLQSRGRLAISYVQHMQAGVALFIQDPAGRVFSDKSADLRKKVYDLWHIVLHVAPVFDQSNKVYINVFDDLIAAALKSRSAKIANDAIAAWNRSFGTMTDVSYPPATARTLRKLVASGVEIEIGSNIAEPDTTDPDSPLQVASHADEDGDEAAQAPPTPRPRLRAPTLSKSPAVVTPRRGVEQTQRRKLRHEDSQIQFEPIASSPLQRQDSDLLTDRQKEVAEKQRATADVIFRPLLSPIGDRVRQLSAEVSEQTDGSETPTTPRKAAGHDDIHVHSSPLVASVQRRRSSLGRRMPSGPEQEEIYVPSSPPIVETQIQRCIGIEGGEVQVQNTHVDEPETQIPAIVVDSVEEAAFESTLPDEAQLLDPADVQLLETQLDGSNSTHVAESFIDPSQPEPREVISASQNVADSQNSQQTAQGDSQRSTSSAKKRKRGRTNFGTSKRRKSSTVQAFLYNTRDVIQFCPRKKFVQPPDMLDRIVIPSANETNMEKKEEEENEEEEAEEVQVPATAAQESEPANRGIKRRRHALQISDCSPGSPAGEGERSAKRGRRSDAASTPPIRRSSSASFHYVEITPGESGRSRMNESAKIQTPEAENVIAASQLLSRSPSPPQQYSDAQERESAGASAADDEDVTRLSSPDPAPFVDAVVHPFQHPHTPPKRPDSRLCTPTPSSAGSQGRAPHPISLSAFKGMMNGFVQQIRRYVSAATALPAAGWTEQAEQSALPSLSGRVAEVGELERESAARKVESVAEEMAEQATRTVEALVSERRARRRI